MGITAGFLMGIVYAATPGPLNVETLRRGMIGGFFDAFALQSGSSIGRVLYALLALFGAGLLLRGATLQLAIGVLGVTLLFHLGLSAIRDWRELIIKANHETQNPTSRHRAFWMGAILSLANPLAVVFWLSIGSRVLYDPGLDGPAFLGGFILGCMVMSLFVAVFSSIWRARLSPRIALVVSWTCGLALIGFGLKLGVSIWETSILW
jgi:threonine/homoserine/homoserine lactone efflux protein